MPLAAVLQAQALLEDFFGRMDRLPAKRAISQPSRALAIWASHLRFGTVSIRKLVNLALQRRARRAAQGPRYGWAELDLARLLLSDLWPTFHMWRRSAFKPEYDAIAWEQGEQAEALFAAWCEGRTGYPLVDAAMAQLNQTGYMHNRLRMVAGSFLVKHLGLDWRWGEKYFAAQAQRF